MQTPSSGSCSHGQGRGRGRGRGQRYPCSYMLSSFCLCGSTHVLVFKSCAIRSPLCVFFRDRWGFARLHALHFHLPHALHIRLARGLGMPRVVFTCIQVRYTQPEQKDRQSGRGIGVLHVVYPLVNSSSKMQLLDEYIPVLHPT
jgi:hypothetical protein